MPLLFIGKDLVG